MPRFYETVPGEDHEASQPSGPASKVLRWKAMLVGVFVYYMLSCGIERIYQPMVREM